MKWSRKLSVVEQRGTPLTALNITVGMWVRVKTDSETVKKLCRGDGEDQVRAWDNPSPPFFLAFHVAVSVCGKVASPTPLTFALAVPNIPRHVYKFNLRLSLTHHLFPSLSIFRSYSSPLALHSAAAVHSPASRFF